jgi:hypothetical protein
MLSTKFSSSSRPCFYLTLFILEPSIGAQYGQMGQSGESNASLANAYKELATI